MSSIATKKYEKSRPKKTLNPLKNFIIGSKSPMKTELNHIPYSRPHIVSKNSHHINGFVYHWQTNWTAMDIVPLLLAQL